MAYQQSSGRFGVNAARTGETWAMLLIALWFFVSPWVLQFAAGAQTATPTGNYLGAAWNAWIASVIIALVAFSAYGRVTRAQPIINLILAVWVFIAPWVLGFANGSAASWDHWICGVLFALCALGNLVRAPRATAELMPAADTAADRAYAGSKPTPAGPVPPTMPSADTAIPHEGPRR